MKNYSKQYLKGVLRNFPTLQDEIEKRREAIINPENHNVDENIGGSSGNRISSVVESVAVKLADDEELKIYEEHYHAVNSLLQKSNKETQRVIELRYFKQLNRNDTAQELGMPTNFVRSLEEPFLRKLARRLRKL